MAKKKQIPEPIGPWRGVLDVGDAGMQDPKFLADALNCYFPDAERGGSAPMRPGFARNTSSSLATTNGYVQCLHGMPAKNGDFYVFAIIDGKLYRQDSSVATTWTDVSPVGITINSATRVYAINFNEEVIFSDGVNKPWRGTNLTSTPITGTVINIDSGGSSWTARNSPTIYGGKVFFIRNSSGSRITWSEEADVSTGYEQTGYTNYWDLFQSGSDRLLAILGTNAALFYWRKDSIGEITGAVNADFQTSATHDSVSLKIGQFVGISASLCAPITTGEHVWFLGTDALPHRFRVGSREVEPIWKNMRRRIEEIRAGAGVNDKIVSRPKIAYSADLQKVAFLVWQEPTNSQQNEAESLHMFDAATGQYEGRWNLELQDGPAGLASLTTAVGVMDIAGVPIANSLTHFGQNSFLLGGSRPSTNTGGHLWRQSLLRERISGDNGTDTAHGITLMMVSEDENVEIKVDRVTLQVVPDTTTVNLDYYTPHGGTAIPLTASGAASSDLIQSSYDHGRCVFGLGVNAQGRWWRGVFRKNASASAPSVYEKGSLLVRYVPASPRAP